MKHLQTFAKLYKFKKPCFNYLSIDKNYSTIINKNKFGLAVIYSSVFLPHGKLRSIIKHPIKQG